MSGGGGGGGIGDIFGGIGDLFGGFGGGGGGGGGGGMPMGGIDTSSLNAPSDVGPALALNPNLGNQNQNQNPVDAAIAAQQGGPQNPPPAPPPPAGPPAAPSWFQQPATQQQTGPQSSSATMTPPPSVAPGGNPPSSGVLQPPGAQPSVQPAMFQGGGGQPSEVLPGGGATGTWEGPPAAPAAAPPAPAPAPSTADFTRPQPMAEQGGQLQPGGAEIGAQPVQTVPETQQAGGATQAPAPTQPAQPDVAPGQAPGGQDRTGGPQGGGGQNDPFGPRGLFSQNNIMRFIMDYMMGGPRALMQDLMGMAAQMNQGQQLGINPAFAGGGRGPFWPMGGERGGYPYGGPPPWEGGGRYNDQNFAPGQGPEDIPGISAAPKGPQSAPAPGEKSQERVAPGTTGGPAAAPAGDRLDVGAGAPAGGGGAGTAPGGQNAPGATAGPAQGRPGMTPEQRRTIQASLQRGQTGDAGTNFGQQPLQTLATDRQRRFANELRNNPQLKAQIMRIAANEQGNNPKGTQAVMESLFNRAAVRNTSLAQEAQWHRGGRGYYQMGSMGRGALENPRSRAMLEQGFNNVVGGSNISNFATDNSSGGLARREMASGRFRFASTYGGETFSSPGTAEPGHARTWQSWSQQMRQPAAPATPPPFQTNDIIPAGQFI